MPARPSSSALKHALSSRSDSGDSASISRHHCTVSSSSWSSGTTALTRPQSSACCASYWRQRNQTSFARFCPIWRASSAAPKPPSNEPTLRAGLAEARVVGGDRQVADDVQDVPAADRVAGDHRDDRLGQAPDLDVQVGDVEAPDAPLPGSVS